MVAHGIFSPDLIVTSEDGTEMAMAVVFRAKEDAETEASLKDYMQERRCPLGLILTPRAISVWRDEYLPFTYNSVRLIGRYPMPAELTGVAVGRPFEDAAWNWLDNLPSDAGLLTVPTELRHAVVAWIRPALLQGDLRAAGFRR